MQEVSFADATAALVQKRPAAIALAARAAAPGVIAHSGYSDVPRKQPDSGYSGVPQNKPAFSILRRVRCVRVEMQLTDVAADYSGFPAAEPILNRYQTCS